MEKPEHLTKQAYLQCQPGGNYQYIKGNSHAWQQIQRVLIQICMKMIIFFNVTMESHEAAAHHATTAIILA